MARDAVRPREAVTADPSRGRRTGIAMPKQGDIPLTQDGFEDPEAFFASPEPVARQPAVPRKASSQSQAQSQSQSQNIPSSAGRRQRNTKRQDVAHEIGIRGRRTGKTIVGEEGLPLGSDGFEDMSAIFAQEPASVPALRRAKATPARARQQGSDGEEDEDEGDMTAAYPQGRMANKSHSSNRRRSQATVAESEQELEEESDMDEGNTTAITAISDQMGRREERSRRPVSLGQSDYGQEDPDATRFDDDNGTQDMDIEGSSYYNRSVRSLGGKSARQSLATSAGYDSGSSPARNGTTSRRTSDAYSTVSGKARSANASSRGQTTLLSEEEDDDDDEEEEEEEEGNQSTEEVRNSLVKSRDSRQNQSNQDSPSRSVDRKGKGKQLFEPPSSEQLQDGLDDGDDDDDDDNDVGPPMDYDLPDNDGPEEYDEEDGNEVDGEEEEEGDEEGSLQGDERLAEDDDQQEIGTSKQGGSRSKKGDPKRRISVNEPVERARKRKNFDEEQEGVRRSERAKFPRLRNWMGEQVIYGRQNQGRGPAWEAVAVKHVETAAVKPLAKRHTSGSRKPRSASGPIATKRASRSEDGDEGSAKARCNREHVQDLTEWDAETEADGIVWDFVEGKEKEKRIAITGQMIDPKPTKNHKYMFQRVFTDGLFMAGGMLVIPPGESKPLKPARDNTYMLFVYRGAVRVLVHRTEFSMAMGGFFLIPRGNSYQIRNLLDTDAELVFMQAREIQAIVEEEEEGQSQPNAAAASNETESQPEKGKKKKKKMVNGTED